VGLGPSALSTLTHTSAHWHLAPTEYKRIRRIILCRDPTNRSSQWLRFISLFSAWAIDLWWSHRHNLSRGGTPMAQENEKPTRDWRDIVAEASKETDPEKLYKLSQEMQRALDEWDKLHPKAAWLNRTRNSPIACRYRRFCLSVEAWKESLVSTNASVRSAPIRSSLKHQRELWKVSHTPFLWPREFEGGVTIATRKRVAAVVVQAACSCLAICACSCLAIWMMLSGIGRRLVWPLLCSTASKTMTPSALTGSDTSSKTSPYSLILLCWAYPRRLRFSQIVPVHYMDWCWPYGSLHLP